MNVYELILFLSFYGSTIPDLQPSWPSFFQPHGQTTTFVMKNLSEPSRDQFTYQWITQGDTLPMFSLPLDSLRPHQECEGAFAVTLQAIHPTGVMYSRTECVWIVWSYYDLPDCSDGCDISDAGWPFYPEYPPQFYRIADGFDPDRDGIIGAGDLLMLLAE